MDAKGFDCDTTGRNGIAGSTAICAAAWSQPRIAPTLGQGSKRVIEINFNRANPEATAAHRRVQIWPLYRL